ncbi:hypothetical protein [Nocardia fluminea]|uniref:hypothetical protein n=1 Tax=Nocardia fluminea TaxID=134984 RepID=UPI0036610C44
MVTLDGVTEPTGNENCESSARIPRNIKGEKRARGRHRRVVALSGLAIVAFGVATIRIGQATADTGRDCLWAGTVHPFATEITSGGMNFTCGMNASGAPEWYSGSRTDSPSTVPNPGSTGNPAGVFSVGALQPGTGYNDYCVGTQLIDGSEDMYAVESDANGVLFWKAAGSISQWRFDPGSKRVPTTQSSSICLPEPVY